MTHQSNPVIKPDPNNDGSSDGQDIDPFVTAMLTL